MNTKDPIIEEAVNNAAKIMMKRIDYEILADMLVENGWTRVTVDHKHNMYEVADWVHENIKGKYHGYEEMWAFREPADVTWFKMRWTS